MNTFPVSKERIDSNIENEKTDLTNPNDWAAQGFPAIDYMLHGIADNKESVIEIYNSNTKYSGYLSTLVSTMSANTDIVVEDWVGVDSNLYNFIVSCTVFVGNLDKC